MEKFELIVAGGGLTGVAAAVAAARRGSRVLLIEKLNCFGGAAVQNLVNPFMPYYTFDDGIYDEAHIHYLSGGIFAEIIAGLAQRQALHANKCGFDEEQLKFVLSSMVKAAGVTVLFDAVITAVHKESRRITEVVASTCEGNLTFTADKFIDATGDGMLAFLSGCSMRTGRPEDGLCQPMTLCFRLGGVDVETAWANKKLTNEVYCKLKQEGKISNPREDVLIFENLQNGVLHFNTTRVVKLCPVNAFDKTRAEQLAREQVEEIYLMLKQNIPGYENSRILSTALEIGVRESRMLNGRYVLTADDMLAYTKFDDGIAACNYDIDIHNPEGSGTSHFYFPPGEYYTIPYRCLQANELDNLLVAGRCASFTHEAQASVRIMPVCCCMGQAAGTAATLGKDFNVDAALLRAQLAQDKCIID